jgi:catechol 2,3-dioxygenase-like lactoylglutathione lyase family enzyme
MLLGGIWHGAGWTFVVWGALHGVLIVANHFWRLMPGYRPLPATLAWPLTFLAVVLAWVPFRAPDLATAVRIYTALLGLHGLAGANGDVNLFGIMPQITDGLAFFLPALPWPQALTFMVLLAGLLIVFFAPNTQSLMRGFSPGLATPGYATGLEEVNMDRSRASWRPIFTPAVLTGLGLAICLMMLNHVTEFIYFQF